MFKLVIQDDEGKTTVVPLIRDEITIGRKEGNTIRLTERNVSRRHARIVRSNNDVQIEDLGSYNGIRVNNARIAERVSLRISDQVQIGDYKLYLKAEGVEQVDDARTVPIERIDVGNELSATTVPLGTPAPVANGTAPAPVLVGNPNRTMVSLSDIETASRPTAATAAAVAPGSHGRLVVLSSNFAGTEFELSRPQMIVGRTDENDLVINHRSISRNHAKIIREADSGRYTISDLQSSNGVRVNGQDYGKVELRRGDVVDLGHVRLRFVEAGEDFVFARDAVITDVPNAGGKRGLMIALALGVLLIGGGTVFMLSRGSGGDKATAVADASKPKGSDVTPGPNGSDTNPATNPGSSDNPGSANPAVAQPDAAAAEAPADAATAAVAVTNPPNGSGATNPPTGDDDKARKQTECRGYNAAKKWQELFDCSQELAKLGGGDAAVAEFKDRAQREQANDARIGKLDTAIANRDFAEAHKILDKIDDDSVYKVDAKNRLAAKEKGLVGDLVARGTRMAKTGKCKDLEIFIKQSAAQSAEAADTLRGLKCVEPVATPDGGNTKPPDGGTKPANEPCDAAALEAKAREQLNTNSYAASLASFEQAIKCKSSYQLIKLAYMAACHSSNTPKAKAYFGKLNEVDKSKMIQICLTDHITPN